MADTTDDMKAKLPPAPKPPVNCVTREEFQDFVLRFEAMQGTVTSTHALMLDVMTRVDFEPPVLTEFRKAQKAVSGISETMSKTVLKLDTQVTRVEAASNAVLELRIQHIKKLIVASILLYSLPASLVAFLLASRAGFL